MENHDYAADCRYCHKKPATTDGLCHRCFDILTELLIGDQTCESYRDREPLWN